MELKKWFAAAICLLVGVSSSLAQAEPRELEQSWAFAGNSRGVERLSFSPDGAFFLDLGLKGGMFRQYSGSDGHQLYGYEMTFEATASALSPDGRYLAMGFYNGSIQLIDTASGKTLCLLKRNQAAIGALAFKRDNSILAASSEDSVSLFLVASDASGKTGLGEYLKIRPNQPTPTFLEWRADGLLVGASQFGVSGFHVFVADPEAVPDFVKNRMSIIVPGPKVDDFALSPDGRSIAVPLWGTKGEGPYAIRVIDLASHKTLYERTGLEVGAEAITFSRDGSSLLWSGFDGKVWRWKLGDGDCSLLGESDYPMTALALYPDRDAFLAGCSDGAIWRGSFEPGTPWELLSIPLGRGAYSPDGSNIVFPADNRRLAILSSSEGRALRLLILREEIKDYESISLDVAYSPDGSIIAMSRSDKLVHLFAADTGRKIQTLGPLEGPAKKLAWSKDGKLIITANLRGADVSFLSAWDVVSGVRIASIAEPKPVLDGKTQKMSTLVGMGFDPGSGLAAEACGKEITIFDPVAGKIVKTLKEKNKAVESIVAVDFIPGARLLATLNLTKTGSSLTLWDTAKWKVARSFEIHTAYAAAMRPSPDGKRLLYWGRGGIIQVCDLSSGADVIEIYPPGGVIGDAAFSPDGGQILVSCSEGSDRVYKLPPD